MQTTRGGYRVDETEWLEERDIPVVPQCVGRRALQTAAILAVAVIGLIGCGPPSPEDAERMRQEFVSELPDGLFSEAEAGANGFHGVVAEGADAVSVSEHAWRFIDDELGTVDLESPEGASLSVLREGADSQEHLAAAVGILLDDRIAPLVTDAEPATRVRLDIAPTGELSAGVTSEAQAELVDAFDATVSATEQAGLDATTVTGSTNAQEMPEVHATVEGPGYGTAGGLVGSVLAAVDSREFEEAAFVGVVCSGRNAEVAAYAGAECTVGIDLTHAGGDPHELEAAAGAMHAELSEHYPTLVTVNDQSTGETEVQLTPAG